MRAADQADRCRPGGWPRRWPDRGPGDAGRGDCQSRLDHGSLSGGRAVDSGAQGAAADDQDQLDRSGWGDDEQPAGCRSPVSAGRADRGHGGQWIGKKLAGQRDVGAGPWPGGWGKSRRNRGHIAACGGRPTSTSWSKSISRRSAARRAAIRPRIPACSTRFARCLPKRGRPGSGAIEPAGSASTPAADAARSARGRGCRRSR